MACMPSWNIHTAHVERLVADRSAHDLGIEDVNTFLFGNYVPDIYVGFMVPDASMHIDYCLTHLANVGLTPMPNADKFWNMYIYKRRPTTSSGISFALGAWAHLVADRFYNGKFLTFLETHDAPEGEELRICKQGDFDVFGHTLGISSCVQITPELLEAAKKFRGYSILPQDVEKSVDVASSIVRASESAPENQEYRLLSAEWLTEVFEACNEHLVQWLTAWQALEAEGKKASAEDIRVKLGLRPVDQDL